jgi:hypothetical protein
MKNMYRYVGMKRCMKNPAANCVATATMATPHTPKRVMTRRFSTTHTIQPLRLRNTKYFCFSSIIKSCPETILRATAINTLIEDPQEIEAMTENIKHDYSKGKYSWNAIAQSITDIYTKKLSTFGNRNN